MPVTVKFDLHGDTWFVHCVAEDGRRSISPEVRIADAETLVHLLRYVGANDAEIDQVDEAIRRESRGIVEIELQPRHKNLLHFPRPWSACLVK